MGLTRRSAAWITPACLSACLLAACGTPRTELLVVTDTDLSIPDRADGMRVEVTGPGGLVQVADAPLGQGHPGLPRMVGIVPSEQRLGPFTIRASARLGGSSVVTRVAEVTLQPGRTLVLRLDLDAACIPISCGPSETCAEGVCRSVAIAEAELEEWSGELPRRDAGQAPSDAGNPDAGGTDAGGTDGGTDAGGTDAGCASPEACNGVDDDCDGTTDEGFDLTDDPQNCGSCGTSCDAPNATMECTASVCVLAGCDAGFDDCDSAAANGCEAELSSDAMHCGGCGDACSAPDRICCSGTCARDCP